MPANVVASNNVTRPVQENYESLKKLGLHLDALAVLIQLSVREIRLKYPEPGITPRVYRHRSRYSIAVLLHY
jgi:hypothetical protein